MSAIATMALPTVDDKLTVETTFVRIADRFAPAIAISGSGLAGIDALTMLCASLTNDTSWLLAETCLRHLGDSTTTITLVPVER
jgi:hypothetical protein